MKIKDIKQFLPKYKQDFDGEPTQYKVTIRYNSDRNGEMGSFCTGQCYHPSTKPQQDELTIRAITAGLPLCGGDFDEYLQIFVQEKEPIKSNDELDELEQAIYDKYYQEKKEREERELYERLKLKYAEME